MSLSKNEVMNDFTTPDFISGQQETNERRSWSHEFRTEHTEVSGSSRRRIATGEIHSEKGILLGRTIRKDQLDKWLVWWQEDYSTR